MTAILTDFHIKTKISFGRGALASLGDKIRHYGARRCLLVADPALAQNGAVDRIRGIVDACGAAMECFVGVEPEPYLDNADQAAELGRQTGAELVVGLGGGSAMDTAKAAAVLITNPGPAERYVGLNLVPGPGLPTIMIPTTAGTGSEVTFTAVFTNRQTKAKGGINSPHLYPTQALIDPELTLGLPPDVTAYTGMDALTHAIESFTSKSAHVFTEALSLTAIRLISSNLRRAVFHGDDIQARENMLMGSVLGGLGLALSGVGAAHALAYPLGGYYRVPHGLANAMLIGRVMAFNAPAAEQAMAMIAKSMGEPVEGLPLRSAAEAAADAVKTLCDDVGIPARLSDIGIPEADIPKLVEAALKVTRPVENNPRFLGPREATMIYEQAFA
jgi:alcohol dehydrogenase